MGAYNTIVDISFILFKQRVQYLITVLKVLE